MSSNGSAPITVDELVEADKNHPKTYEVFVGEPVSELEFVIIVLYNTVFPPD